MGLKGLVMGYERSILVYTVNLDLVAGKIYGLCVMRNMTYEGFDCIVVCLRETSEVPSTANTSNEKWSGNYICKRLYYQPSFSLPPLLLPPKYFPGLKLVGVICRQQIIYVHLESSNPRVQG